ncbi:Mitochondrial transcription factor 1 [Vanrija albida]|uniref:Mitochondrial transcription factor 1 n=1 Tax=Vanrija albida TaxID=181172 RepID=A0ABR3PS78_9TREE
MIPRASSIETSVGMRESVKRHYLTSPTIANHFVRDLRLRPDEVVIDAYASTGVLTRALLAGGRDTTTPADWAKVSAEVGPIGAQSGKTKRRNAGQFTYPPWDVEKAVVPKLPREGDAPVNTPALVVACDPAVNQLSRGLGFDPDVAPPGAWDFNDPQTAERMKVFPKSPTERDMSLIYPSQLEDRLKFCIATPFLWDTVPGILSNQAVWSKLPVYDETKEGVEATKRPWTAPAPPITLVASVPDTTLGEQMVSQWIGTVIGSDEYGRSWLWQWGRVRLALMVTQSIYDSGETIRGKLSVLAQALFHIRPLPPYHHVPDVDKQSKRVFTDMDWRARETKGVRVAQTTAAPPPTTEVTVTERDDWFPPAKRSRLVDGDGAAITNTRRKVGSKVEYADRPLLLGLELTPREDPLVLPETRDSWEYVLRKLFVRESQPLGAVLPSVAFGAENLLDKIEAEDSPYAGKAVGRDTIVRNLDIDEWHRIVDVFDKWAFRPDTLIMDSRIDVDESRQVGLTV